MGHNAGLCRPAVIMRFSPDIPLRAAIVDGTALHYQEAGDGPALLLVHGSLCDCRYWQAQIGPFARTYRVIAPSLRHYWPGGPQADTPFSIATHADELAALLAELQIPRAHVLGHSRGARVALALALQHPSRVAGLVLADPSAQWRDAAAAPVSPALAQARAALDRGDPEAALGGFVDAVNGANTWSRMVEGFKRMARDNAGTLPLQVVEPSAPLDADAVTALTQAVLLVGGAQGPARYAQAQDKLHALLPAARRVVIDGAAHGMNLAKPHSFNTAVLDFLRDLDT